MNIPLTGLKFCHECPASMVNIVKNMISQLLCGASVYKRVLSTIWKKEHHQGVFPVQMVFIEVPNNITQWLLPDPSLMGKCARTWKKNAQRSKPAKGADKTYSFKDLFQEWPESLWSNKTNRHSWLDEADVKSLTLWAVLLLHLEADQSVWQQYPSICDFWVQSFYKVRKTCWPVIFLLQKLSLLHILYLRSKQPPCMQLPCIPDLDGFH